MIKISNLKLMDLAPQFLKKAKNIIAFFDAVDEQFRNLFNASDLLIPIKKLYETPHLLSDYEIELLMWENHVDYYDPNLTREQKIELIKEAPYNHMIKGTRASVENPLKIILNDFELSEWFETGGKPFTFKFTSNKIASLEDINKATKIIDIYKNLRSKCEGFLVTTENIFNQYHANTKVNYRFDEMNIAKSEFYNDFINEQQISIVNTGYRFTEIREKGE